jgi:hypothetical protein
MYEAYGKQVYKNGKHWHSCNTEGEACRYAEKMNEAAGYGKCWHR